MIAFSSGPTGMPSNQWRVVVPRYISGTFAIGPTRVLPSAALTSNNFNLVYSRNTDV